MNVIFVHLGLYCVTKYEENPLKISRVKSLCGFWAIICLFGNTKPFLKKTLSFSCNHRNLSSSKNFKKSLELIKSYKDKAFSKTNWHTELFCKKFKLISHCLLTILLFQDVNNEENFLKQVSSEWKIRNFLKVSSHHLKIDFYHLLKNNQKIQKNTSLSLNATCQPKKRKNI